MWLPLPRGLEVLQRPLVVPMAPVVVVTERDVRLRQSGRKGKRRVGCPPRQCNTRPGAVVSVPESVDVGQRELRPRHGKPRIAGYRLLIELACRRQGRRAVAEVEIVVAPQI